MAGVIASQNHFDIQAPHTEPISVQQLSIQHCRQKYHLIKRLGSGDNGEAYAAIHKCDAAEIAADHGRLRNIAYFADLRNSVVAIKFAKEDLAENDLADEINVLKNVMPSKLSVFTYELDSHFSTGVQWLALPFVSGGSLQSLIDKHPEALNLGFRYHVGAGLARAMLFVLYGITDGGDTPAPGWPRLSHGDLYACNLLLDPEGGYQDYPRVIIADFGRARHYRDDPIADELCCWKMFKDVGILGDVVDDLNYTYATETELEPKSKENQALEKEIDGWAAALMATASLEMTNVPAVQVFCIARLQESGEFAQMRRQKHYQSLPSAALAELRAVKISDELLGSAIPF